MLGSWAPTTEHKLYVWIALLMAVYFFAAIAVARIRGIRHNDPGKVAIERTYNAGTWAGSLMIFAGVLDPAVLAAIGSLQPFLLVAAFAGISYSTTYIFRNNGDPS